MKRLSMRGFVVALGAALVSSASADLRTSPVFTDHAVLQRDASVPIWGRATPGSSVKVRIGERGAETTTTPDGRWRVELAPMPASATPHDLVIEAGDERVIVRDVLIGDVWMCGGQSNMEWPMSATNGFDAAKAEAATGKRRTIRALKMPHTLAEAPLATNDAQWKVVDGDTVGAVTGVGYSFARIISDRLGVPVGILDINWGGTPIEPWMKDGQMNNGMIAPVTPYAITGALWYQGESNAGAADKYADQLRQMIAAWRDEFRNPAMPFGIVQLAAFQATSDDPVEGGWSALREAQAKVAASDAQCGLAVLLDVGDAKDIHPRDKETVGSRLAAWALATAYKQQVPEWSSPVVERVEPAEMTAGKKAIRVRFAHGDGLRARQGEKVDGFAIAGADGKFVWAEARVDARSSDARDHASVLVWSDSIAEPVEVAYAWQNNPVRANLVNGAGWPAGPFKAKASK
ncbi:MAG: sialate O-acetylesterase [Phycisphaerales bacterium]